jgi:hypothetical protein
MTLSIIKNTETTPKPLLSLKQMTAGQTVKDDNTVLERAQRYDFALGEAMTPGVERLAADIRAGNERYIRDQAARQADLIRDQTYVNQVNELARMGDTQTLDLILGNRPARSNPNTILEEGYASRLLEPIYFGDPGGPQTFEELTPSRQRSYTRTLEAYNDIIARDEVIQRKTEEYLTQWRSYNFATQAWDFIETLIPMKDWLTFSTELETPGWSNINLPGDSKLAQVTYLHSLPLAEFEAAFTAAVESIARVNINQTFEFIQAVQAYGRSDQTIDNILFGVDLAGVAGTAARIAGRGASAAARTISNATTNRLPPVDDLDRIVDTPTVEFPERAAEIATTGRATLTPEQNQLLEDYEIGRAHL